MHPPPQINVLVSPLVTKILDVNKKVKKLWIAKIRTTKARSRTRFCSRQKLKKFPNIILMHENKLKFALTVQRDFTLLRLEWQNMNYRVLCIPPTF